MGRTGLEGAHPDADGYACHDEPALYPWPRADGSGDYMAGTCPGCGACFEDGAVVGHGSDGDDAGPSWRAGVWAASEGKPAALALAAADPAAWRAGADAYLEARAEAAGQPVRDAYGEPLAASSCTTCGDSGRPCPACGEPGPAAYPDLGDAADHKATPDGDACTCGADACPTADAVHRGDAAVCGLPLPLVHDGEPGPCGLCGDDGPHPVYHYESQAYVVGPLCPKCGDADLNPGATFHTAGPTCTLRLKPDADAWPAGHERCGARGETCTGCDTAPDAKGAA